MRDNKAFASLTSGLLARKGQARPAMRPQGFTQGMGQADDLGWNDMGPDEPRLAGARLPADLAGPRAVNATGEAEAAFTEVHRQQDEIAREFADPVTVEVVVAPATDVVAPFDPGIEVVPIAALSPAPKPRTRRQAQAKPLVVPRMAGRKAAFTLRLEADRHLLLRLACAVQNRSAQQIVTEALDRLLADLPDVARLAASLPSKD